MSTQLTINLPDEEATALQTAAGELELTPVRLAERIIRRAIGTMAGRSPQSNRARATARATRQLELLNHLRSQPPGVKLGQTEKQALAERFGVAERTMYRDVEVALEVLERERQGTPE